MLRDERLQKVVAEVDAAPDRERVRAGWLAGSDTGHWQRRWDALCCSHRLLSCQHLPAQHVCYRAAHSLGCAPACLSTCAKHGLVPRLTCMPLLVAAARLAGPGQGAAGSQLQGVCRQGKQTRAVWFLPHASPGLPLVLPQPPLPNRQSAEAQCACPIPHCPALHRTVCFAAIYAACTPQSWRPQLARPGPANCKCALAPPNVPAGAGGGGPRP